MSGIEKQIQDLQEKAVQIAELKEDVFQETAEIGIEGLGVLLRTLNEGLNTLFEGIAGTEHFDKKLGENLQITISEAINKFTQVKHEINFAPNINVDTKPLQSVITDAIGTNKQIYNLVEKLSNNNSGKFDELYRLVLMMIEKHNNHLEKLNNIDLTPQLAAINVSLNKTKTIDAIVKVTKRDEVRGFFQEATIKSTNAR